VSPVVVPLCDEVNEPEGVVRSGDRSAVLGLDGDIVADPILAQPLAGHERAELPRRAHSASRITTGSTGQFFAEPPGRPTPTIAPERLFETWGDEVLLSRRLLGIGRERPRLQRPGQ